MRVPMSLVWVAWNRCVRAGMITQSPFNSDTKFRKQIGITNKQWKRYKQTQIFKVRPETAAVVHAVAGIPINTQHMKTLVRAVFAKHNIEIQ